MFFFSFVHFLAHFLAFCQASYSFIQEYDDERDADDAIRAMDGNELDGARIVVEASHGGRDRSDRRGPGSDECFSCGGRGHWYVFINYNCLAIY